MCLSLVEIMKRGNQTSTAPKALSSYIIKNFTEIHDYQDKLPDIVGQGSGLYKSTLFWKLTNYSDLFTYFDTFFLSHARLRIIHNKVNS